LRSCHGVAPARHFNEPKTFCSNALPVPIGRGSWRWRDRRHQGLDDVSPLHCGAPVDHGSL